MLSEYFDAKGYDLDVLHDHGPKKGNNVGEIVSWSRPESESRRGTALSQLDIAVVDHPDAKKVIALIEIEESEDKPKVLLADVLAAA